MTLRVPGSTSSQENQWGQDLITQLFVLGIAPVPLPSITLDSKNVHPRSSYVLNSPKGVHVSLMAVTSWCAYGVLIHFSPTKNSAYCSALRLSPSSFSLKFCQREQ